MFMKIKNIEGLMKSSGISLSYKLEFSWGTKIKYLWKYVGFKDET